MVKLDEIHSLTDFQRNAKSHIKRLKQSGCPAVLTVNGKASLVVQDASAYQELIDLIERGEVVAGISRGLDSMNRGEGEPASDVFARIRRRQKFSKK